MASRKVLYVCPQNGTTHSCLSCHLVTVHRFEIQMVPGDQPPACKLHGPLRRCDVEDYYRSEQEVRPYDA